MGCVNHQRGSAFWHLVKGARTEIRKVYGQRAGDHSDDHDCCRFCFRDGIDFVGTGQPVGLASVLVIG